ncbi:hypothetical protein [Saccharibacillus kuerlensis]|uniref:Uncharacterized protein n=1 Tax=Saccharibacillus kuerlensis TaxID=459527 RepID=A0ABQ2KZS7_9BACL|nr:hypothetical protein [Saccharibacillus kuerlensis]GGN96343.1 hypothetical protein GCM10010969_13270 [Saccharibacillus kuerlensis]
MSKNIPNRKDEHSYQEGFVMVRELRTILVFTLASVAVVVGLSFLM